ncbi:MAG: PIN domain-containing protein [Acidovorax sp.]|nr:PIN domain-containing protein [Acidovorax sp.]
MSELHALLDFENIQPTLEELQDLVPGFTDVWLFHGLHQLKSAQKFETLHSAVTLVPSSGKGPNALDFHLTFYLGYVAAKHPDARMVVVSNDKDYDPMIRHAQILGFTVQRVGRTALPSKVAKPAATKKTVPVAKAVSPKKAAPPKPPVAKKAAAVKKAPAKKVAAKKAAIPKPPATKVAARPKAVSVETKDFTRIKNGLAKMGNKAPRKFKSFLSHVKAQLGKASTAAQVDAMVQKLEKAGLVHIAGDLVLYGTPSSS